MWAGFDVSCDMHVSHLCFRGLLIEHCPFFVPWPGSMDSFYRILHLTRAGNALQLSSAAGDTWRTVDQASGVRYQSRIDPSNRLKLTHVSSSLSASRRASVIQ